MKYGLGWSWADRAMEEFAYSEVTVQDWSNTGLYQSRTASEPASQQGQRIFPCACHTISEVPQCGALHLHLQADAFSSLVLREQSCHGCNFFTAGLHEVALCHWHWHWYWH
jgi:hypothetical protein